MMNKRKLVSKSYYKVKKSRFLRQSELLNNSENDTKHEENSDCENPAVESTFSTNDTSSINLLWSDSLESSNNVEIEATDTVNISSSEFSNILSESSEVDAVQNINEEQNIYTKIHNWAINNIAKVPLSAITELLAILKSEGYVNFPNTAHSLLGFKHSIKTAIAQTKRGSVGDYIYLGIKNGLEHRIDLSIFKDSEINVMVHIDGMNIFRASKGQLWPILVKISNKKYICLPFIVAMYYGDSKPKSVDDYLKDFVNECTSLINDGIELHGKKFAFKIVALIADGPARAYLKCIKGPTAYFGCERCNIEGLTINRRRVYPQMNCEKRCKQSFIRKDQPEHHLENMTSPLIHIPNFDPVKDVVLDNMHLVFLGALKNLLEKLLLPGSPFRLHHKQRKVLKDLMNSITPFVPKEFQRRKFDIDEVTHWKATQYRFMLLYCGPIILQFVLSDIQFKHFLLLHVACRILCSSEIIVTNIDVAEELLRKFVLLLPTLYGEDSQVMNFHNLIHIADDVRHLQAPLSDFSAFWGENFIGKLKNLVYSTARPLQQIVNRLNAMESSNEIKIRTRYAVTKYALRSTLQVFTMDNQRMIQVNFFEVNNTYYSCNTPDNVVLLCNYKIFIVNRIFIKEAHTPCNIDITYFYIEGVESSEELDIFKNPCSSKEVCMFKIEEFSQSLQLIPAEKIKSKCMSIKIEEDYYVASLLHSD